MPITPYAATESHRLAQAFVAGLTDPRFAFDALIVDILRYQDRFNTPLRNFWRARGFNPAQDFSLEDVPAVPTDVFRFVDLCSEEAPATGVFRTSGTTSGARGQHFHLSTIAYDAGALRHFQDTTLERAPSAHFIHIALDPAQHPDSSLSHMLRVFGQQLGRDARSQAFYYDDGGLRADALRARLHDAHAEGAPVILFGTAFGLADTLDRVAPVRLPEGSRIVQTGGFKGRREALTPDAFYQALAAHYHLGVSDVLAEYGMTELSSQLYTSTRQPARTAAEAAARRLIAPAWCRVDACDPETLRVLPQGQPGLLRFTDCANIDAVAIVQSSDLGVIHPDGLELLGRAPGGVPRGCSLAIDELRAQQSSHT